MFFIGKFNLGKVKTFLILDSIPIHRLNLIKDWIKTNITYSLIIMFWNGLRQHHTTHNAIHILYILDDKTCKDQIMVWFRGNVGFKRGL